MPFFRIVSSLAICAGVVCGATIFAGEIPLWSDLKPLPGYVAAESELNRVPCLASDGQGGLMSLRITGHEVTYSHVIANFSADGGQTWTTGSLVNKKQLDVVKAPSIPGGYNAAISADVVFAGNNTWVCQWISAENFTSTSLVFHLNSAVSIDAGLSWKDATTTEVPSIDTYPPLNNREISLAADGSGTVISSFTTSDYKIETNMYMTRSADFGMTWSEPTEPYPGLRAREPKMAFANGTWYHAFVYRIPVFNSNNRGLDVATSTDGGLTWLRKQVHWQLGGSSISMMGDLTAVQNTAVLTFQHTHPQIGNQQPFYETKVSYSTDAGTTWSSAAVLSSNSQPAAPSLAVATDNNGEWTIINTPPAANADARALEIYRTDDLATTWTSTFVSRPGKTLAWADVKSEAPGQFLALYEEKPFDLQIEKPDVIKAVKSEDAGTSWADIGYPNLTSSWYFQDNVNQNIRCELAPTGTALAAWSADVDGTHMIVVSRSVDLGNSWSTAINLPGDTSAWAYPIKPSLKYNGGSNWTIWDGNRSWTSNDDGLTWGGPITGASQVPENEYVASSARGTTITLSKNYVSAEPDADFQLYATATYEDGTSSPARLLDTVPTKFVSTFFSGEPVRMGVDWIGGTQWICVWEKFLNRPVDGEPYNYRDSRVFFSVSEDDGNTWSTAARLNEFGNIPNDGGQNFPEVSASNGNLLVVWQLTQGDGVFDYVVDDSEFYANTSHVSVTTPAEVRDWTLY